MLFGLGRDADGKVPGADAVLMPVFSVDETALGAGDVLMSDFSADGNSGTNVACGWGGCVDGKAPGVGDLLTSVSSSDENGESVACGW